MVGGIVGEIGVRYGHDLVILAGFHDGTDDRYLWVGEPGHARTLAAMLNKNAGLAEAAMRRATETDRKAGRIGPCGHDGCNHPTGHDGRHSWQDGSDR